MAKRRSGDTSAGDEKQSSFAWRDAARVLAATPDRGEVVYQAPELSKISRPKRAKVGRVVRVAPGVASELASLGLPFGVKTSDGRAVCWSCSIELDESAVLRTGPGYARCPGCGAKIPFAE